MGRHRTTGPTRAQQAALLATGAVTSHRRARRGPRARAAAVLAVGVLASGVVISAATTAWFQEAALPQSGAGESAARPADRPAAAPAPTAPAAPTAGPAVVAAPTTPQAPPPTLWRADLQDFRPTPWNTAGVAPARVDDGQVSVRLTGRGQRSELEPDLPALGEGDRHDVTLALCLDGDFPVHLGGRQVLARWENDGPGLAPIDLRVRDGHLVLHGGEGHPSGWRPFDRSLGPVPTGQWVDVALRVHFSANPDKARVSAWRDGERVLSEHHPRGGTLYPGQQSHLKVGLHRDAAIAQPAAVHFRDVQVVQSRAASQPERQAVSTRTTSGHPSIPEQRSSSSSGPKHRAAEHRSTDHGSTQHRPTKSGTSSSGTHSSVPRNTPSHVATSRGASRR